MTALASTWSLGVPQALAAPPYSGRPLDDALREIASAAGLRLVYTTELVPPQLTVDREPAPAAPLDTLRGLLADAGLRLERVDERTYAVVRAVTEGDVTPAVAAAAAAVPLEEVVVTSSRYALASDLPGVRNFLSHGELDAVPRLAEDTLKAVHRLPGAASNGFAGIAHLRGGGADETLVLLDGLPLYEPFHLRLVQGPVSVLDERIVQDLEAWAGGYTAEFGDRMSGIVAARSLRPEDGAVYELGLSLVHATALASQAFAEQRGRWLVSFRRSNLDELADAFDSSLGEASYSDGFARLDYAWSPSTRGSLHALVAHDRATLNNSAETERSDVEYANEYLWATLEHEWSPRFATSGLLSYTDVTARRLARVDEPELRTGRADDDREYGVIGLRVDARHAGEHWLQRAGIDVRTLSAGYRYDAAVVVAPGDPFPGPGSFVRASRESPSGEHFAAYYTVRTQPIEALTVELGLRWDEQTYGVDADDQLAPRAHLAWRMGGRTRLLASLGRYQQFQGIEELQVEDGVEDFQRAQRADHAILGLEHEFDAAHTLRVEAYRKRYSRLRTRYENLYDPLSLAPELRWDRIAVDPESGRAEGVELLLTRRPVDAWHGWFAYAWSRATDRVDGIDERRSWDQPQSLSGGVGWTHGPWQATLAAQYHSGWPVTPVALDAAGVVQVGARNSDRYAHFASVDARVSRDWAVGRGTLTAHVEVTNALDRRNPCCTDFVLGSDGAGAPVLERDLRHWLPLVPSVGVLWKFGRP